MAMKMQNEFNKEVTERLKEIVESLNSLQVQINNIVCELDLKQNINDTEGW